MGITDASIVERSQRRKTMKMPRKSTGAFEVEAEDTTEFAVGIRKGYMSCSHTLSLTICDGGDR
jgi:hypothetical protein